MDLWEIENEIVQSGVFPVCGVDEAGRGPLAGPVCAAAVILPPGILIEGLRDPKKLSAKTREELFDIVVAKSQSFGIAFAEVEEIERFNIQGASYIAMNRAISKLNPTPALALIDGNRNAGIEHESRCIVRGDAKCASIAAAAVLAKVSRDRFMLELHEKYPQYGFATHKGYPTKAHYAALTAHGPCEIHRRSFLRKFSGIWGEEAAANYLKTKEYKIVDSNFTCRFGEIDLIAEDGDFIVFIEVKLRKSNKFTQAREYVTQKKQMKIINTASLWLSRNETGLQPRFDVIEIYAPDGTRSRLIDINHIENAFYCH